MSSTVIELPSMSKPVTFEPALAKTLAISVLLGTDALSKVTFIVLTTDPCLQKKKKKFSFKYQFYFSILQ